MTAESQTQRGFSQAGFYQEVLSIPALLTLLNCFGGEPDDVSEKCTTSTRHYQKLTANESKKARIRMIACELHKHGTTLHH